MSGEIDALTLKRYGIRHVSPGTFLPKDTRLTEFVGQVIIPELDDGMCVYEIMAGSGVLTKQLAMEAGKKGLKVDFITSELNPKAVADAKVNLAGFDNVDVREGDLLTPLKPGERVDIAFCNPPWFSTPEPGRQVDPARVDLDFALLKRLMGESQTRIESGTPIYLFLPNETLPIIKEIINAQPYLIEPAGHYITRKRVITAFKIS